MQVITSFYVSTQQVLYLCQRDLIKPGVLFLVEVLLRLFNLVATYREEVWMSHTHKKPVKDEHVLQSNPAVSSYCEQPELA